MSSSRRACTAVRRDGQPCTTPVLSGSSYCWGHDPAVAEKRQEARRRGGQNRANAARLAKIMPIRLVPVWERLERALGELHQGDLDPKVATAMAALGRALATILTAGELEERLRRLEARSQEERSA